jgi:hypothetical protein
MEREVERGGRADRSRRGAPCPGWAAAKLRGSNTPTEIIEKKIRSAYECRGAEGSRQKVVEGACKSGSSSRSV